MTRRSTFWWQLSWATVVVVALSVKSEAAEPANVCKTEICNKTANIFKSFMDETIHPCNHFYQFTCGNFYARTPIPPGRLSVGPFEGAYTNQINRLKEILSQSSTVGLSTAQRKAATFYKTCVESELNPSKRTTNMNYLKQILNEYINGWPLTTRNWDSRKFDLTTTLAKIASQLDQSFFMSPLVLPDMGNSSRYTITIVPQSPSSASFPFLSPFMKTPDQWRQEQSGKPRRDNYYEQPQRLDGIIREVACIIDPDCARNPNLYSDVMTLTNMLTMDSNYAINDPDMFLNERLNRLLTAEYAVNNPVVEDMRFSIPRLNRELPLINWNEYFRILLQNTNIKIDNKFKVLVDDRAVNQLHSSFQQLDDRELSLFFGWHLIIKYGRLLSPQLRSILSPGEDESDVCLHTVNDLMGHAVARLYNAKYVPSSVIEDAGKMIGDLKNSVRQILQETTWMDSYTKNAAVKKMDNMVESIAAPDWVYDNDRLDKYYEKVSADQTTDFPTVFKNAKRQQAIRQFERHGSPVNRQSEWVMESPAITNAMYFLPSNSMYFGSGMLQFPFYEHGRPSAVNFGAFGWVAGHEITHGFDTAGSTRNANGELENWWMTASGQQFQYKAQCMVNQYGSIRDGLSGMKLNGMQTIGENIADNGGLRAAFKAYKNSASSQHGTLIGLEKYTEDQLFFISAALTYCTKSTREHMVMTIVDDVHSPSMYRALVPLMNFEEFHKAFKCPRGSPMNPSYQCRVW